MGPNQRNETPTAGAPRAPRPTFRPTVWLVAATLLALAACGAPTAPPEEEGPGALVVLVDGLPAAAQGDVRVTGPGGYDETLSASETLAGLAPGSYAVSAQSVSSEGVEYAPTVTGSPASVTAGAVSTATVSYAATSTAPGDLVVDITGLPPGVDADVTVAGPDGESDLTETATLAGVEPGTYTVTAAQVDDGGDVYAANVVGSPATVSAGGSATVTVAYTFLDPAAFGSLEVTVDGLPGGVDAAVDVTGPAGFDQDLVASTTLNGLTPGNYVVTGADVSVSGLTYTPRIEPVPALVIPDETTSVAVTYLAVAENDLDAASNPGLHVQFRNTSGEPVWVDQLLFNSASRLDVKGVQLRNDIGNPADPGDWIAVRIVHGQSPTTSVEIELECLTPYDGSTPIRVELRDDDGAKIGTTVTCDTTRTIAVPNEGGQGDYLVSVLPTSSDAPYYMRYVLSIDAFCFQACAYQPHDAD